MSDSSFFAGHSVGPVHFVGIGGIGMSGLARILAQSRVQVSGSDQQEGEVLDSLRGLGVRVEIGHREENLGDAGLLVVSSAISGDNVELEAARRRGLQILHRSEMLAELLRYKVGIAVSGTHGKTTTSAMIATLLKEVGLDPTAIVGARLSHLGTNAVLGSGPHLVCEADESDRSFLRIPAVFKVVTNIDTDHMDVYRDLEDLENAFLEFMNSVPFYGLVVACRDDPGLQDLIKKVHRRVLTYGLDEDADVSAKHLETKGFGTAFTCFRGGGELGRAELHVPGRHNVQNALAAVAVGLRLEVPFEKVAEALACFQGTERRQQFKGERGGVAVIDDYGHHPTEIRATLDSLGEFGRRTIVVYQPHRYTRTEYLMDRMGNCFEAADRLFVMGIYAAGEEPIPGVDSRELVDRIRKSREATFVEGPSAMVQILERETEPGDLVVTMGAGDVWKVGEEFLG